MTFLIKSAARVLRDLKTFVTTEPVPHWTEYLSGRTKS